MIVYVNVCDRGVLCHGPHDHAGAGRQPSVHAYGHGLSHHLGGHGHGRARRCGDDCGGGDVREHALYHHVCGHVRDHGHVRDRGYDGAGVFLGSWLSPEV